MQKFPYSDDPDRCPVCGSRRIKRSPLIPGDHSGWYFMAFWCKKCNRGWSRHFKERYRLIESDEVPEDEDGESADNDEEENNGKKED